MARVITIPEVNPLVSNRGVSDVFPLFIVIRYNIVMIIHYIII